jgi:hypothetical protein
MKHEDTLQASPILDRNQPLGIAAPMSLDKSIQHLPLDGEPDRIYGGFHWLRNWDVRWSGCNKSSNA